MVMCISWSFEERRTGEGAEGGMITDGCTCL